MKKILSLVLVSALGGALTLGTYKVFIEKPQVVSQQQESPNDLNNIKTNFNTVPTYAAEVTDFTMASEKTLDAVVHVKNRSVYTTRNPIEELFYGNSSGAKRVQIGMGSGVIVSSDGYIITNNHVINGANEIEIILNDKKTYIGELVGTDVTNDIALVKIDAKDLPYVTFGDSDNVKVGEWVLAVGNPYNLTATVTAGIISAKGRDLLGNNQIESYIQTDAVVNSGNSGGALVNTQGELVGINTMITSTTGSYIGYSFAVPSNIAKKVIEDIIEYGNVQRAFIGINYRELNGDNNKEFSVPNTEGVIVTNVLAESGAEIAGVKENDIIVKANNVKISTFADLNGFLNTKRPDDIVDFTIVRNGKQKIIPVKLYKNVTTAVNQIGLNLENLELKEAKKYNLKHGVKISNINNEKLEYLGLRRGQIITNINGKEIQNVDDVNTVISGLGKTDKIVIEVLTENGVRERYLFR
ncbi:trypsin-like peptidase domain-containing protein [Urechidicola croceus]|uniref:Serine protease n=1 Tax=Urechidicola croceus TaxID=1850246 RepID=A0A1D8P3M9_9FLAO|nr:trypsin-like peptidase domain-containing protein [Urechidicola croceus]AOW19173.1 serine protease [Urechidicola croceus]